MHTTLQRGITSLTLLAALSLSATRVGQPAESPPALTAAAPVAPVASITGTTVVLIDITGSAGDAIRLESSPEEALTHCTRRKLADRDVLEFYWPGHPAVEFIVFASSGASSEVARYRVPADGVPVPDPPIPPVPPNPDPPIPDPPLPTTEVVIVRETSTTTPEQAAVILDRTWEQLAREAGVTVQRLDRDQLPARLLPLKDKAKDGPVVCFICEDVAKAVVVPLPDSAEALTEIVREKVKP